MRRLGLRDTKIRNDGLASIVNMKDLEYLDLNECSWIGDEAIQHMKGLTKLKELRLWLTRIGDEGVAELAPLTNLERLSLEKTRISDEGLANLKPLVNLVTLDLSSNEITDEGLQHLTALTKLQELNVAFCTGVTEEGINALKQAIPSLKKVEH
jgi:Leucine-rich repeat (LRR) protein